jgi:hypothetical protein
MSHSMTGDADFARVGSSLTTPFREHLDHCKGLDERAQLEECAGYIQHIDLLVMEFLESYYLVERLWQPSEDLAAQEEEDEDAELVLEPFYESLELRIADSDGRAEERLVCVSGAVSPLPGDQHPALSRRGLDFVGLRFGLPDHIVLGVAQSSKDETPFLLLLRALNALAELSPPLRVVQLGREIVRSAIPEDSDFSLLMGVSEWEDSPEALALSELTRDLAEAFATEVAAVPQLSGTLGEIACIEIDSKGLADRQLKRMWRIGQGPLS